MKLLVLWSFVCPAALLKGMAQASKLKEYVVR
jgi:hypothetical protein